VPLHVVLFDEALVLAEAGVVGDVVEVGVYLWVEVLPESVEGEAGFVGTGAFALV
jgi:hypothetical protein